MSSEENSSPHHDQRDERIDDLQHTMHQMQQDLESKFARWEALVLANRPPLLPHPIGNVGNHIPGESSLGPHGRLPKPKLDAPKTDGSHPLRWLYKVQEYFAFYDTPPTERLRCVTLMPEGTVADWYHWRRKGNMITSWEDFMTKFKLRFNPLHYVDYFGQLVKLRQSVVMEYQTEFERILQHLSGAPEANLVSLFHSGLKPYMHHEIALLAPESLADSFALAREPEAKHAALLLLVPPRHGSGFPGGLSKAAPVTPPPRPTGSPPGTDSKPALATPIRQLTRAEKLEKDAKGKLVADPSKLSAMVSWPTPKTLKQLRGFLGLAGYYRCFIRHYSHIAAPLTNLLKKDAFSWDDRAQATFEALKKAMKATPVINLPNFSFLFVVETDASAVGIRVVLL
ncbi:unnamed protein product [Cuscuta campestris]|uniref:Retrotransposon gag domain-containing protein n=1 Tax=Cuscuta campestris TaxID=132261 RepID=A0A484K212_9ASTE|nr:unnamed protein product [Cuscuta campestris]